MIDNGQLLETDVAIVGGSVAGCTLALLLAQEGFSSIVLDKAKDKNHYKKLCTHFIQPHAFPVIRKLGLDSILRDHGIFETMPRFSTRFGWIESPSHFEMEGKPVYAYAAERSVLDPLIRLQVENSKKANLIYGVRYDGHTTGDSLFPYVATFSSGRESLLVRSKLLVAADGRRSSVAKFIGNEPQSFPNDRAACLGYFEGIPHPEDRKCSFYLTETNTSFFYPLGEQKTLLSVCVEKELVQQWRKHNFEEGFIDHFRQLENGPKLDAARLLSPIYSYDDYPNFLRQPVKSQVPFLGDALQSLDAMSGVGIGFAIEGADILTSQTKQYLSGQLALDEALLNYEEAYHKRFDSHIKGILKDALIVRKVGALNKLYENIVKNQTLQHSYIAMTGRVIEPEEFQKQYLVSLSGRRVNNVAEA